MRFLLILNDSLPLNGILKYMTFLGTFKLIEFWPKCGVISTVRSVNPKMLVYQEFLLNRGFTIELRLSSKLP